MIAVLFAHGVTEDGAEETDVLAHRFGGLPADLGSAHRADGCEGGIWGIGHDDKYRRTGNRPHYEAPATGTIGVGVGVVEVTGWAGGGGAWPKGSTIGVAGGWASPPSESPELELCAGGQSTLVGGQLSPPPEPPESPGGGQPDPAPKSPAPVQSACAAPAGAMVRAAEHSTTAAYRVTLRIGLTTRGCRRRR
ncbi:hypothetical protein JCM12141A_49840 [Mycolicibacterium hodleri]